MKRLIRWVDTSDALLAHWLRAAREALLGEMPVLAAGTALFAMFAMVPTLAAVVSTFGVIADPAEIESQLGGLTTILPPEVVGFITNQLEMQAKRSDREVGIALAIAVVVALFSARGAARAMIAALNRAYRVREVRSIALQWLITILMAVGTLVGLLVMFAIVVALPAIFAVLSLDEYVSVQWMRWPALMAIVSVALAAMYRFAPAPRKVGHFSARGYTRHVWPGAGIATLLLVILSLLLSLWVSRVASYNAVYGAFGSVVVVMLWMYLSVIAIVIGGFVNAELERHAGAPAPDRSMY